MLKGSIIGTLSLNLVTVLPLPFVMELSIRVEKFAIAVSIIVLKVALIRPPVVPEINPIALLFV
jgi:hypothetical protein